MAQAVWSRPLGTLLPPPPPRALSAACTHTLSKQRPTAAAGMHSICFMWEFIFQHIGLGSVPPGRQLENNKVCFCFFSSAWQEEVRERLHGHRLEAEWKAGEGGGPALLTLPALRPQSQGVAGRPAARAPGFPGVPVIPLWRIPPVSYSANTPKSSKEDRLSRKGCVRNQINIFLGSRSLSPRRGIQTNAQKIPSWALKLKTPGVAVFLACHRGHGCRARGRERNFLSRDSGKHRGLTSEHGLDFWL